VIWIQEQISTIQEDIMVVYGLASHGPYAPRAVVAIALISCVILVGCATRYETREVGRKWELQYEEEISINTEPNGARIYCDGRYIGVSPVNTVLEVGKIRISQHGAYSAKIDSTLDPGIMWIGAGWIDTNVERGPTTWNDSLVPSIGPQSWAFEAHKQGYRSGSARVVIRSDSRSLIRVVSALTPDGDKLPDTIRGHKSVLISLREIAPPKPPPIQQQQQQQQTLVIPGMGNPSNLRGMVIVTSTPQNAEVYADGAFVGNTPANLKLAEGIHMIEVKMVGYRSYRRELRVIGNSELNLRVTLDPV